MERLWNIIDRENIKVRYEDLSRAPEKIHGLYLYDNRVGPLIILDQHLHHLHQLHRCVLAEEIGHFYTAARTNLLIVHTSANLKTMESQDELKAARWATNFLIPDNEFVKALEDGYYNCFDLADYFSVTQWFMYRKLEFFKIRFGETVLKFEGRDLFKTAMVHSNIKIS